MIKLLGKLPKKIYVACSGGVDSMAALDFLRRGDRDVHALYFNHGTDISAKMGDVVIEYCRKHNIPYSYGLLKGDKGPKQSQEEFWRIKRYEFLDKFKDVPVITCHHLNDNVEQWIFSSMTGKPNLIPAKRDNYVRPFLLNKKEEFVNWAEKKNIHYVQDPSNADQKYMRNFIRHTMIPNVLVINPGIFKTIKKKTIEEFDNAQ